MEDSCNNGVAPLKTLQLVTYFEEINFIDDCFETETLLASKFSTARQPHLKPDEVLHCSIDSHISKMASQ